MSSSKGSGLAGTNPPSSTAEPKTRGANRSTKVTGRLKVLPDEADLPGTSITSPSKLKPPPSNKDGQGESTATPDSDEDGDDEDEGSDGEEEVEIYNEISLIPEGKAKRDALRLTKRKAKSLPRVTAYATANSYVLSDMMKFFNARKEAYHTNARKIDEVIYTPYLYEDDIHKSASRNNTNKRNGSQSQPTGDLLGIPELVEPNQSDANEDDNQTKVISSKKKNRFDAQSQEAEIFAFSYGCVVIWNMTEAQEKRFLSSIRRFEVDKLDPEDVEMEDLNYYYANYSRIYNDVITLRKGSSYMTKLSLSHALAQSVKVSLFENRISTTIEETKDIPDLISMTGQVSRSHKEIMQRIGELFLLKTDMNSVGSVLDSPEVFWTFPDLQPLYDAARSYLEIPQRIDLLNTRVEVLQDMLQLLKDSVSSRHAERLEQIVIALIAVEIVLGIITILVDLFA